MGTRHWRPASFDSDSGKSLRVAWIVGFHRFLVGFPHKTQRMQTNLQLIRCESSLCASLTIEIHQGSESVRFPTDHSHHQRKSQRSCPCKRSWRTTNSQPDRKSFLNRSWVDGLIVERRSEFTRPSDPFLFVDLKQQAQLLGKELIIVFQFQSKQRKGFCEGTT